MFILRVDERSADSFIGCHDFFPGKVSKFVHAQIHFSAVSLLTSFSVQFISFVEKRKANSTFDQQKCKGHEKLDRLLLSKVELNYRISQPKKIFISDPVVSNGVNFYQKKSIINC